MPTEDMLIAAIAQANNATLVTQKYRILKVYNLLECLTRGKYKSKTS